MRLSFASRIFLYPLATTGAELGLLLMNGGRPRERARERERERRRRGGRTKPSRAAAPNQPPAPPGINSPAWSAHPVNPASLFPCVPVTWFPPGL
ncbi:hypothetical protein CHARACLAT_033218 [Characodon lateralis]|uniref:Uncharacterized protein n=1 Tax=Characodon lateralis TaxID=208331 RepID=A0ABU7EZV9_9TELE|nr:hypothetical protein [Characodon lateralis]